MECGIKARHGLRKIDATGCIKPEGHSDSHICKTIYGETLEWEDDYKCDCGCWDSIDTDSNVCVIYKYL